MAIITQHFTFLVLICALHSYATLLPNNPGKKDASQGSSHGNNNQGRLDITNLSNGKEKTFDKAFVSELANNVIKLYGTDILLGDLLGINTDEISASDQSISAKLHAVNKFGRQKISVVEPQPINLQIVQALGHLPHISRKLIDLARRKDTFTPEIIAQELISGKNVISVIQGPEGSGKTVLLKRIAEYLRAESKAAWTILIDLNSINIPAQSEWHPTDIFKQTLGHAYELFMTLLDVNPTNVNILLDNIDQIPLDKATALTNYVRNLMVTKVGVVFTSTHKFIWHTDESQFVKFLIPELSLVESKLYLTNNWIRQYGNVASQYYRDYAQVLTGFIKKNEIPLTFRTGRLIANLFANDEDQIGDDGERNKAFKTDTQFHSLNSYANVPKPDVHNLQRTFTRIRLNKLYIFEKLTRQSKFISEHYNPDEYGIRSLERILVGEPEGSLPRIELNLALSNLLLMSEQKSGGLPGVEFEFQSPFSIGLYEHYFATRYLLTNFRESASMLATPMSNVLTTIFGNLRYSRLVDFINSAVVSVDYEPAIQHMCGIMAHSATAIGWHQIMDNLLSTGMDNIASMMFDTLSYDPEGISDYFGKSLADQPKIPFAVFDHIRSDKSSLKTPCTRQEMMFRNGMESTINTLRKLPEDTILSFRTIGEYESILQEYLMSSNQLDSGIYIEIRNAMIKHTGKTRIGSGLLNKLLFYVLKNCGTTNLYIANHLVRSGARPELINYHGETLVHLAVRHLSIDVLNYVVDTLKVPIPRGRQFIPILSTLLDTNPVKQYSPPRFWTVTAYLLARGEIEVPPPNHMTLSPIIPQPTVQDMTLPACKAMVASARFEQPYLAELISELKSMPFPFKWLSSEVRSLRRNIVLTRNNDGVRLQTEPKTLTEILMSYKGFSKYKLEEKLAFQNAIFKAISQDCSARVPMSQTKQTDLVRSIINNAVFDDELIFAHRALKYLVYLSRNKQAIIEIITTELKNSASYRSRWNSELLEKRILETNAEHYLSREVSKKVKNKLSSLMAGTLHCLNAQRRRRSPMDCLMISDDEMYAEVTGWMSEIEENGEKIRVIDSDKFVDIMEEIWYSDRIKYRKLIEIARRMVEKDGVKVIGNLIGHFEDYIERKINTELKMTSSLRGQLGPSSPNMGYPYTSLTGHSSESVPSPIDASSVQNIPLITHPPVANEQIRFGPQEHSLEQPQHFAAVGRNQLYRYNPHEPLPVINYNYHYELPHVVEMPSHTLSIHIPELPVARSPPRPAIGNIFRRFG